MYFISEKKSMIAEGNMCWHLAISNPIDFYNILVRGYVHAKEFHKQLGLVTKKYEANMNFHLILILKQCLRDEKSTIT